MDKLDLNQVKASEIYLSGFIDAVGNKKVIDSFNIMHSYIQELEKKLKEIEVGDKIEKDNNK